MEIVYAAERASFAALISEHSREPVDPVDVRYRENPDETGSFYIDWKLHHYTLQPGGRLVRRATLRRLRRDDE